MGYFGHFGFPGTSLCFPRRFASQSGSHLLPPIRPRGDPCGFALLLAVLGRFIAQSPGGAGAGLKLGMLLTLGTLTAFGALGLALSWLGSLVGRYLIYLNLLLGLGLLALGVLTLLGKGAGLGVALQAPKRDGSVQFYGFGLAYGFASLGCALPVFLSVVGFALTQGLVNAVLALLAYGLGMGAVLTTASLLVGLGQEGTLKRLRQGGRLLETLGALLLLLAGGYLVGYQAALILQAPTRAGLAGTGLGLLAAVAGYGVRRYVPNRTSC